MNNVLYKTKTYLAGPMQYKNGEGWRNKLTPILEKMGVTVFNPYNKPFLKDIRENDEVIKNINNLVEAEQYDEVHKIMKEIRAYDLNLVDRSDFLIFYIDPTVPTYGTTEELSVAVKLKRPIFIAVEPGRKKCPLWIRGMLPDKYIYNTIDEISEMLIKINNGEKEIDSDRWRLLKPEFR